MSTNNRSTSIRVLFLILSLAVSALVNPSARADTLPVGIYQAFSLREAVTAWRHGKHTKELADFAGISRFIGAVHAADGDIILIGRVGRIGIGRQPKASFDDFAVALRSAELHGNSPPYVSIDPTEQTTASGLQAVNFGGGIENTQWGMDFLNADIFLKMYSLGQVQALTAIPQYRAMLDEQTTVELLKAGVTVSGIEWVDAKGLAAKNAGSSEQFIAKETIYQDKFWFTPKQRARMAKQEGVLCIEELQLAVQRQALGDSPAQAVSPGERFAASLSEGSKTLVSQQSAVARIKILYDLYVIAQDIAKNGAPGFINDLANHYPVKFVETPQTYPMTVLFGFPHRSDGVKQVVRLSGGLSFASDIQWLNDGDITPLRKIVQQSRPKADSLTWALPLNGWNMPNAQDLDLPKNRLVQSTPGFVSTVQSFILNPGATSAGSASSVPATALQRRFDPFGNFPAPSKPVPAPPLSFDYQDRLGGVSMQMPDDGKTTTDHSGSMAIKRNQILQNRPQ